MILADFGSRGYGVPISVQFPYCPVKSFIGNRNS